MVIIFPIFLFVLTWIWGSQGWTSIFLGSHRFQQTCESLFVPNPLQNLETSLICGTQLQNPELVLLFKKHSLFHLIVVSGSHFLWINEGLKKIKLPLYFRWALMWIYNVMTGFQAPGTRSLLQIFLTGTGVFPRLRSDQIIFLSGTLYLIVFPIEVNSISLILSWTAALSLSMSSDYFRGSSFVSKFFLRQLIIALILYPWMWLWGNAHPLTLFSNLLLGPLIMGFLFPYSILDLIFHFPFFLNQFVASSVTILLTGLGDAHLVSESHPIQIEFFWLYLFFLHSFQHFFETRRRRAQN